MPDADGLLPESAPQPPVLHNTLGCNSPLQKCMDSKSKENSHHTADTHGYSGISLVAGTSSNERDGNTKNTILAERQHGSCNTYTGCHLSEMPGQRECLRI